jgi:Leucine-rich repeat (LRR) protein
MIQISSLMKSMASRLKELDLSNNQLGPLAAEAIATALPHCPALSRLALAWNSLAGGAQHLAWSLVLIVMQGRGNGGADARTGEGTMKPQNSCLEHLDLAGTNLVAEVSKGYVFLATLVVLP